MSEPQSTTARKSLVALVFIIFIASGCGGQPEPLAPPKPVVFRQKISMPKELVSETAKPGEQVTEKAPKLARKPGEEAVGIKAEPLISEKKPGPEVPAEGISRKVAHLYNPSGKLDPFEPIFVIEARKAKARKKVRKKGVPLTPLQKVELSQLKLVGIIISAAGNKALVEDPSGKGYVVTEGMYVGTDFGRVKKILNDRVIVEEEVEDFVSGGMKRQTTELRLQKKLGDV